jgi:hypothetical protein
MHNNYSPLFITWRSQHFKQLEIVHANIIHHCVSRVFTAERKTCEKQVVKNRKNRIRP